MRDPNSRRYPPKIEEALASATYDNASDALNGLVMTMHAAVRATISMIEIGITEILSGRFGEPTEEDMARIVRLQALLDNLKGNQQRN